MKNYNYKVITDITEAEKAWESISPKKRITDEWLFRYEYYKYYNFPIKFFAAYDQEKIVGLLPLQFNTEKKYLEFFGGSYMEDNQIYLIKGNEEVKQELIKHIDVHAVLEWMAEPMNTGIQEKIINKYELDLTGLNSIDDYLSKHWSSKARSNIKAQIKKIEALGLKIEYDNPSDFKNLVRMNKERFGKESSFYFPNRVEYLESVIKKFDSHFISIYINGKLESVGLSFLYKDTYIGLNSGTNLSINGLGKYLSLQKIKQAINLGAKTYDARAENLGWKESFDYKGRPQYFYELNK